MLCIPTLRAVQINMRPDYVVLNFGLELFQSDKTCGDHEKDENCPYVPDLCKFLTEEKRFRVVWQTTTPRLQGKGTASIGVGHHLHIPQRCKLDPSVVLNRVEVLYALEPDLANRMKLYHDHMHLLPAPYHAFNGRLIDIMGSWDEGHGTVAEAEATS